jgi:DNA-binding NtrC family response regulator
MEQRKTTILIVEDDRTFQDDPFVVEAGLIFENIIFEEKTSDALSYIKENLSNKIIILLDIAFSTNQMDGIKFLEELRSLSKIIPVIIWSGKDNITEDEYKRIINDTTFAFLTKGVSSEEIVETLSKADDYLNSKVDSAIESWLENHSDEEKNKPFLATSDGRSYSMNDLLREIRMQTKFGQSLSMDINKLTLDLLFRNKESL